VVISYERLSIEVLSEAKRVSHGCTNVKNNISGERRDE